MLMIWTLSHLTGRFSRLLTLFLLCLAFLVCDIHSAGCFEHRLSSPYSSISIRSVMLFCQRNQDNRFCRRLGVLCFLHTVCSSAPCPLKVMFKVTLGGTRGIPGWNTDSAPNTTNSPSKRVTPIPTLLMLISQVSVWGQLTSNTSLILANHIF